MDHFNISAQFISSQSISGVCHADLLRVLWGFINPKEYLPAGSKGRIRAWEKFNYSPIKIASTKSAVVCFLITGLCPY